MAGFELLGPWEVAGVHLFQEAGSEKPWNKSEYLLNRQTENVSGKLKKKLMIPSKTSGKISHLALNWLETAESQFYFWYQGQVKRPF